MRVQDLTVEVRNRSFERVGQLVAADLTGLLIVMRYNNVGSWSITLPSTHRLVDELREAGSGLIVSVDNDVIFSGFTTSSTLEQSVENPLGDWLIEGVDDSVILAERLAYPLPSQSDVTLQTVSHDVRVGNAETVLKGYVSANISSAAGTVRAIPNLIVETNLNRGSVVTGSARFDNMQELFYGLAQTGEIGYRVEQNGQDLEFQVFTPVDRSAEIRMDLDNGQLTKAEYAYGQPKNTRVIVGGAGEAEERLFYEGFSSDSVEAEILWSRRIEVFVDSRSSDEQSELVQAADEKLVDDGKTIVNLSVVPSDDQTMRFAKDWYLGDKVAVVAGLVETTAVVTEVGLSVQPDGVRIGATVGTPTPVDYESQLISTQRDHQERISNLERNTTGFGISTVYQPNGGTDGTQPTFSGPAIAGSYTRFGNLVHFQIQVDFTNITSFGTGQYFLTLPHNSSHNYMFREGCLHDASSGTEYHISAHVLTGEKVIWLFSSDKVASGIQDVPFTSGFPATLSTADNFHISGTYEIEI